ncbi:hypothetical protein ACJX0J_041683, partial [Zea mays]
QRESGILVKPRRPRGRAVSILVKARPCRVLLGLNLGGELLREALDLVGEHGNIVPKAAVELWLRLHVQEQDDIFERPDLLPLPQAQVLGGAGITRRRDA